MNYDALYEEFFKSSFDFIVDKISMPIIKNRLVCKDIVIEALEKSMNSGITFDTINHLSAWVRVVVKNDSINYMTAEAIKWKSAVAVSTLSTPFELPEDNFERQVRTAFVNNLIEGLSPRCAAVLKLIYVENLPMHEIAMIMNIKYSTVKNQHSRGLSKLREKLGVSEEQFMENCRILFEKIKNSPQSDVGVARLYGVSYNVVKNIRSGQIVNMKMASINHKLK